MALVYVSNASGSGVVFSGYYTLPEVPRDGQEYVGNLVVNGVPTATAYRVVRSTVYHPGSYMHSSTNVDGRVEVVVLPDGPPPPPP